MKRKSSNPYLHVAYWMVVILTLTLVFGLSWGNNLAAFYFVSMLLPIVLGTSYFFNYILVPGYFMTKRYFWFALYSVYTIIISFYLETLVLMFSFIYLGNFNFHNLGPNASDTVLLAVILYLLVFLGSFLLLIRQIKEKQQIIARLSEENDKMKKSFLEVTSKRKLVKIPYENILYIESLADYVRINTMNESIESKEKISHLASRLPEIFMRIHRSFIINREKIKSISYDEVVVSDVSLTIGRSYRKEVREALKG
ncbi:MAG: LytR/AlgR family response regulator transcription factor [Bacteroidota bacterium]